MIESTPCTPPRRLIWATIYNQGRRLLKMPEKVYPSYSGPYCSSYVARHYPRQGPEKRFENGKWVEVTGALELPEGNLPFGDYAYWIGSREKSMMHTACRFCGQVMWNFRERKAHFSDGPRVCDYSHAKLVTFIAGVAKNRGECISCSAPRTRTFRWGVPLCNTLHCITQFMFESHVQRREPWCESRDSIMEDLLRDKSRRLIVK